MSNYVMLVDDGAPRRTSPARGIAEEIGSLTLMQYLGDPLEGVSLPDALENVRARVREIRGRGDIVSGFAFDLAQQNVDVRAGLTLLTNIRADHEFDDIPAVIYTYTHIDNIPFADLIAAGALAVVVRRMTGGCSVRDMAEDILKGLGLLPLAVAVP